MTNQGFYNLIITVTSQACDISKELQGSVSKVNNKTCSVWPMNTRFVDTFQAIILQICGSSGFDCPLEKPKVIKG